MKTSLEQNPTVTSRWLTPSIGLSLVLIGFTLGAYWGVWHCNFLGYDDPDYFTKNRQVQAGLSADGIKWAFTTGDAANWHPLTWLSLMLDASLFGTTPAGPHVVNLVLHIADTVLLFWVLRRLTGAPWQSFWVAALFGLHPMHVESVAWVAERKDVLSALFFLLTLLAYGRYVQATKTPGEKSYSWYWIAFGFFALGLMSKPMLVTLPFVLLLLDWWPLQRFHLQNDRSRDSRLLIEKLPFLLLSILASVVTFVVQKQGGAVAKLAQFSLPLRVENALVSYGRYVIKTLIPYDLAVPYPSVIWPISLVLLGAVFLLGVSVAAIWFSRRSPFFITGWFWFAGMLVPVIGLVQVGGQSMADRYHYLPSIGLFIVLVWGVAAGAGGRHINGWLVKSAGLGLLMVMAGLTQRQTAYWRDDGTLFSHALAVTQNNYVANINYGAWLSKNGDAAGALEQYNEALQLNPADSTALYNVGNGLAKLGDWERAIECYQDALRIKADQADVLNNLGFALAATKQWTAAVTNLEEAVKLKPDYGEAHNNLASVLYHQGDFAGAASHFTTAAELMPGDARIEVNLGDAWRHLGQLEKAAGSYRQALQLEPDNERARAKLEALANPATK